MIEGLICICTSDKVIGVRKHSICVKAAIRVQYSLTFIGMLKKKYTWHIIIWLGYILYQYSELFVDGDIDFASVALTTSYIFMALSTFYLSYFFVWKPFLVFENRIRLVIGVILCLMYYVAVRFLIDEIIFEALFGFGNYFSDEFVPYFLDNIWRAVYFSASSLIVALLEKRTLVEKQNLELKNERKEAEMSLLRSQLNPHFLFNTLSFLYTKTLPLDPALGNTILKLSDMLRYSMQNSQVVQVDIEREIELVENYIAIFENRFEGKFFVKFYKPQSRRSHQIEPLLLIPFVENMFKHGVMHDRTDPGQITLSYQGDEMIFECRNKINNHQKDKGVGIGLENVKRRLSLLYPDKHTLKIKSKDGYFIVRLTLKVT